MSGIEGTWSLSFLGGLLFVALAIIVLLAIASFAASHWEQDLAPLWAVSAVACIPILLGITACATFPWESEYHRYEPKVGKVVSVDKRLVSAGDKGMQEKLVVRFADMPGQWGCEDTRCASVRPGDMLALRCIKRWDYSASDGYDCRFVAYEPKAEA
jgi:hypothetical protein